MTREGPYRELYGQVEAGAKAGPLQRAIRPGREQVPRVGPYRELYG